VCPAIVAARPSATVLGYLVGGLCWFSIPFFLATTLGLAGVALERDPDFPTYPERMAAADVSAGLVAPNAAVCLLGESGAVAILILVFLAVTSAASAELIAVSSIIAYDIYKAYIKPTASGEEILKASQVATVGFGIFMGVLASVLNNFGITLGYLYLLMGIIVAPAVIPIAFTLTWSKQNTFAAIAAPVIGFVCGLITWLVVAYGLYGEITLVTTRHTPQSSSHHTYSNILCTSFSWIDFNRSQYAHAFRESGVAAISFLHHRAHLVHGSPGMYIEV